MELVRAQGAMRPTAVNTEAMDELKLILSGRETLYGRADRELDTSSRSVEECRMSLAALLKREGFFPGTDDGNDDASDQELGAA